MRNVWCGLLFLAYGGSIADAETVRFEPASQTVDLSTGATTTDFAVYVEATAGVTTFNSVDLLIGSDDVRPSAFVFDPDFAASMDLATSDIIADPPGYRYAIFVGAFTPTALSRPVLIGTVTVDVAGSLPGSYTVEVNFDRDSGASAVALLALLEPLFGNATVEVIGVAPPECVADADCGDGDACTSDTCVGGMCAHASIAGCGGGTDPTDGATDTTDDGTSTTDGSDPETSPGDSTDGSTPDGGTADPGSDTTGVSDEIDTSGGATGMPRMCGAVGMASWWLMTAGVVALRRRRR